jgi:CubicO group peptidase (beta-lactamase class C family)
MPITEYALNNAAMLGIRAQRFEILENLFQKFIDLDYRQTIVVQINRGRSVLFEGCYGTNTKPYGVKSDLIFPVASITKPVVGTLLMLLQEDGLVDLNDPVSTYLPEFTGGGKEKICPWHFLTHSSGIKDDEIWGATREYTKNELGLEEPGDGAAHEEWEAFEKKVREKLGLDANASDNDRLNDAGYIISLKQTLTHGPRSRMTYCNYGYQKLKEIIDAVTGEPIDVFAQRRLFAPLGMTDTYWNTPKDKWDRILGRGDTCEGSPWINTERNYTSESGSGGMKTTVGDITKFARMVNGNGVFEDSRILSRRSIEEMTRDHNEGVPVDEGDAAFASWGLGFNIKLDKKDDSGMLRSHYTLDHGGWAGTKVILDSEEDITAAIFTAEYKTDVKPNASIYGKIINVLYSALE